MSISLEKVPTSGGFNSAGSYTERWRAKGESNRTVVIATVLAATPQTVIIPSVGTLYRQDIAIDPDGYAQFYVTVPYDKKKRQLGSYSWSFDTTGGTTHVRAGREHIGTYGEGVTDTNPHHGAIGVKADKTIEGVDIPIPAMRLTVSFRHPQGVVSPTYSKILASAVGYTNLYPFLGFDVGELLFLGASGSGGSESETELAYNFLASANVEDLVVGGITIPFKGGHHYVWLEFGEGVDGDGGAAIQPSKAHVERMFDPLDFATVFGWS